MTPKTKVLAIRIITGLVALTFVVTGVSKLASVSPSPENFARWGFSTHFMYLIGTAEVVGAIGLVIPVTASLAALGLVATMLGALKTGIEFREAEHIILPLVLTILLVIIAYARRASLVRLVAKHPPAA